MNRQALLQFWHDECAVTSTEYALMLAVLSLAAVIAFSSVSTEVQTVVSKGSDVLQESAGMGCAGG